MLHCCGCPAATVSPALLATHAQKLTSSLMVAYLLLASGHDERLHKPVTLYSLRQKFCVLVLALKLQ